MGNLYLEYQETLWSMFLFPKIEIAGVQYPKWFPDLCWFYTYASGVKYEIALGAVVEKNRKAL